MKVMVINIKSVSIKEYLDEVKPYFKDTLSKMKTMVINIKPYQSKNTFMKSNHTFTILFLVLVVTNNLKKSDTWKIKLTIVINYISSEDNDEDCAMHSKRDNIEIKLNDKADEITELFQLLLSRYQIGLEAPRKGSDFVFNYVHLLYYKCHKIILNQSGSCIDFPNWINQEN